MDKIVKKIYKEIKIDVIDTKMSLKLIGILLQYESLVVTL